METTALNNISPTLLRGMLASHKNHISKGIKVYNAKDISLDAWFKDEITGEVIRISFIELPEEIRKGIHDYTTRLSAEKLLIETALESKITTTP